MTGTHVHVPAVIEHASRPIRVVGAAAHPTAAWVAQAVQNLVMDLEDAGCRARLLIRDRDGKFPTLFDGQPCCRLSCDEVPLRTGPRPA